MGTGKSKILEQASRLEFHERVDVAVLSLKSAGRNPGRVSLLLSWEFLLQETSVFALKAFN